MRLDHFCEQVEAQSRSALENIADLVGVEPDSEAPTDLSTWRMMAKILVDAEVIVDSRGPSRLQSCGGAL